MILRSPLRDLQIPRIPLHQWVLENAPAYGDLPALIDGGSGRTYTYAQLPGLVSHVAEGLAVRGLVKREVVAFYAPNVPEYAIGYHGVLMAGGVVTTVNPLYTVEELARQLNDSQARYLFTVPAFVGKAREAAAQAGVREIFVIGEATGATPFQALLESDGPPPEVRIDPEKDLAVLPYSSGTTGMAKGVMLSHSNLVSSGCQITLEEMQPGETVIAVLPFFHVFGQHVIMNLGLRSGATIITLARFDLEIFLRLSQDYRTARAYLVPPILLALAKHPMVDRFQLCLKTILVGAAPVAEEVAKAVTIRLGCVVRQGYGMTETSTPIAITPPGWPHVPPTGLACPVPNSEVKIVDVMTGEPLGVKQEGEICVRGPQIMMGYHNNKAATEAMIDPEGWLHTGDIGYFDDNRFLYVVDRVKELIKFKGLQVAPAELEALLLKHPAVADAAVIGVSDAEAGELPKAFVVKRSEVTAEELMEYVAGQVAPHKKVRMVDFVDAIPKSPSGKILRRELRARQMAQAPLR